MRILLVLMISFCALSINAQTGAFNDQKANLQINDLYAFNSYENGREGFVTIIANFAQSLTGDFSEIFFDPNANYEIHIDSDGDGIENQTYRFKFKQKLKETITTKNIVGEEIAVPFLSSGNLQTDNSNTFKDRSYGVELIRKKPSYVLSSSAGIARKNNGKKLRITKDFFDESFFETDDFSRFDIPENLIDSSSFTDYNAYANGFVYDLDLSFNKCEEEARVFVGQRKASFKGNLSGLKNNLNFNFLGTNGAISSSTGSSVLSIALELPKSCLDLPNINPVIGVWASIHYPARSITKAKASFGKPNLNSLTEFVQIDRMAHPFVNELLIGYNDKLSFSQRRPRGDEKEFSKYFQYPVLAELIEENTSFTAPNLFPRDDINDFYLFGIADLNQFIENKKTEKLNSFEALRLNTTTTALVAGSQNSLGLVGTDNSGYPNGRRPGDDVVDIFFRTLMGFFQELANAPDKDTAFSDGVSVNATEFQDGFPYLNAPSL
jgi:hypothetical protein